MTVGELRKLLAPLQDTADATISDMDGNAYVFSVAVHAESEDDTYDACSECADFILPYYLKIEGTEISS